MPARDDSRKRKASLHKLRDDARPKGTQQKGAQGKFGIRGAPGTIGRPRGIGKPGPKRRKGVRRPLPKDDDVLNMIVTHFDNVYQQLNSQGRLVATMRRQLDVILKTLYAH
jgi:hypothetical protein